jgi:hypothetical protein
MVSLYLGGPACGKSTLLRKHIYQSKIPNVTFLIMDRDLRETWAGPVFHSVKEVRSRPTLPRYCVFAGPSGADVAQLAIEIGNAIYVDEEVHNTFSEGYGPATLHKPAHPLFKIAHEGRHLVNGRGESCEVAAMLATHRTANLPADLTACSGTVYLGRTSLFRDAERAYREGWVAQATSPREAREILSRLRVGDFLHFRLR